MLGSNKNKQGFLFHIKRNSASFEISYFLAEPGFFKTFSKLTHPPKKGASKNMRKQKQKIELYCLAVWCRGPKYSSCFNLIRRTAQMLLSYGSDTDSSDTRSAPTDQDPDRNLAHLKLSLLNKI